MIPSGNSDLIHRIGEKIQASPTSSLPIADFMRLALYDPDFGYYAAGSQQRVGRSGDFYTSVSVGECFGRLLAGHFLNQKNDLAQVVEQGANDGQLASDLLDHLPAGINYIIVEPFPALRQRQQATLGDRAQWVPCLEEIEGGITGQFICNELLDAFPVHRLRLEAGEWRELHIDREFNEVVKPITDQPLADEVSATLAEHELPDGYTTELHLEANTWAKNLRSLLQPGARATIIDYGHDAENYYSLERNDGTLRGYREHKQVTNSFEGIGETDLTASVNFTRIAELLGAGKTVDQHHFLIEAARPWLASIEATGQPPDEEAQKLLRQFNTLIHPGLLGQSFKVLDHEATS